MEIAAGKRNEADTDTPSFNCTICPGTSFDSQRGLTQHCQGKRHLENVDISGKLHTRLSFNDKNWTTINSRFRTQLHCHERLQWCK
jgi:hypothetical protein